MELIGTLPNLWDKEGIDLMLRSDEIAAARYNSGVNNLMSAREVLMRLKELESKYHKPIYIDLKGRQLRITSWADPKYEVIELNHDIEIEYPAKIYFRGCLPVEIAHTRKNKVTLLNPPRYAVGKGQSVNIIAKSLSINGYLTDFDKELLSVSNDVGMFNFMASFVESSDDLKEIKKINPNARIISKIESVKGVNYILQNDLHIPLMIGRDDLFIEMISNIDCLKAIKALIKQDPNCICASKVFSFLEKDLEINLCDYEDIELMKMYGYKRFMLSDEIKGHKLTKALNAWRSFYE